MGRSRLARDTRVQLSSGRSTPARGTWALRTFVTYSVRSKTAQRSSQARPSLARETFSSLSRTKASPSDIAKSAVVMENGGPPSSAGRSAGNTREQTRPFGASTELTQPPNSTRRRGGSAQKNVWSKMRSTGSSAVQSRASPGRNRPPPASSVGPTVAPSSSTRSSPVTIQPALVRARASCPRPHPGTQARFSPHGFSSPESILHSNSG